MGGPEQFIKCDMCGSKEIAEKWPFEEDMVVHGITETRQNCVEVVGTILEAHRRHRNILIQ
jgi:hypothetical protein